MKFATSVRLFGAATLAALLMAPAAQADSGFYLGASVGNTTIEEQDFDEDDTSWKAFGGYIFDMPVVDFAVEAAYIDFGNPEGEILQVPAGIEATGVGVFGLVGLDWGLFGMFAKAGYVSWDADVSLGGLTGSDSGEDPGYGIGLRFNFSSVEIRAEYELFDIEDTDVDLLSLGILWRF